MAYENTFSVPLKHMLEEYLLQLKIKKPPIYSFEFEKNEYISIIILNIPFVEIEKGMYEPPIHRYEGSPSTDKEVSENSAALEAIEFLRDVYRFEVVDYNYNELIIQRHQSKMLKQDIKIMKCFCRDKQDEAKRLQQLKGSK